MINHNLWDMLKYISSLERIYIVMHRKADLDSAVSGYILYKIFTRFFRFSNCFLIAPDGLSEDTASFFSKGLMKKLKFVEDVDCSGKCALIFVDVGGEETLSGYRGLLDFNNMKMLIDHHVPMEKFHKKFNILFADPTSSSSLEIILREIYGYIDLEKFFSKRDFRLMIYTLIVETRFLHLSNWKTLELLSFLMKRLGDARLGDYYRRLFRTPSLSEKLAILKGFQRLRIFRYNDLLMGITNVSAFQNSVSSKLVSGGLDIVIVYSAKKECKVHIRLSDKVRKRTKLNAVKDIIKVLGNEFGGSGGGHAQLGNIVFSHRKCRLDIMSVVSEIINILEKKGYSFNEIT